MRLMKRAFLATLLVFGCVMATSSAQAGPLGKVKTANGTPIVGGGGSNPGNGVSRNGSPGNFNGGAGNFAAGSSAAGNGTNGQHHGPSK